MQHIDEISDKQRIADHNRAINLARAWWYENPLFLDTETTGLDFCAEACDLAIIEKSGQVRFNSLINPTLPMPEEATAIHGITAADLSGCKGMNYYWHRIQDILSGRFLCGYNLGYDLRILYASAAAWHIDPGVCLFGAGDVMQLYAMFVGDWDDYRHNYRWWKLGQAAEQCGIASDQTLHRALADAELTRQIIYYLACQLLVGNGK